MLVKSVNTLADHSIFFKKKESRKNLFLMKLTKFLKQQKFSRGQSYLNFFEKEINKYLRAVNDNLKIESE